MLGNNKDDVALIVPAGKKFTPSSEYDQVPCAVVPVMAIPPNGSPLSGSATAVVPVPLLVNVLTLQVMVVSSSVEPSVGEVGVSKGA